MSAQILKLRTKKDAMKKLIDASRFALIATLDEVERRAPARRGVACPECADLEIGAPSSRFMVPMRGIKVVMALHEPERRAPARRGVACPERADLEIGAPSPRFTVPTRALFLAGSDSKVS